MLRVRIISMFAACAGVFVCAASANAADYAGRYGTAYHVAYPMAGATHVIEFFDGQDPIYTRRYWDEPWLGRRFYPGSDVAPRRGRVERIPPADRKLPPPAETYYRYWSTPPGYEEEFMRIPPPVELPLAMPEHMPQQK